MELYDHIRRRTLFRSRELRSFHRELVLFHRDVVQYARGVYAAEHGNISHTEALLYRTPHAIACLQSALWLQQILGEEPRPVRFAIAWKARRPRAAEAPFETWRWKEAPDPRDIVHVRWQAHRPLVPAFSAAKTVVDLIRARRRIGVETAYDLADFLLGRHVSVDELLECAARNHALTPVKRFLAQCFR